METEWHMSGEVGDTCTLMACTETACFEVSFERGEDHGQVSVEKLLKWLCLHTGLDPAEATAKFPSVDAVLVEYPRAIERSLEEEEEEEAGEKEDK